MSTTNKMFNKYVLYFLFMGFTIIGLTACGGASDEGGTPPPAGDPNKVIGSTACLEESATLVNSIALADTAKGGKIYDKWWAAISNSATTVPAPTTDHPMWSQQSTNSRTGADTWRCKECHGWDYKGVDGVYGDDTNSHYTGFTGIFDARTKSPIDVYCAIHSGSAIDAQHNFSDVLSDIEILHVTKFIIASQDEIPNDPAPKGVIDVNAHISAQGTPIVADPGNGEMLYADGSVDCASSNCHGTDGTAQHEAVGSLADDNPWETLHKIRFGHPGSNMPAFSSPTKLTMQQSIDIIAYAQNSLPNPQSTDSCLTDFTSLVSQIDLASAVRGGRMYDKWWIEAGATEPTADHPIWATRDQPTINTRTGSTTWRCKECHGWDYQGVDGVYGDTTNSHYTGFASVMAAQNKPAIEVFCAIRNGTGTGADHRFSPEIADINILHLTKFILAGNDEGLINTSTYIDTSGSSVGSSATGETLYTGPDGCSSSNCHGIDGTAQPEPLGALSVGNPWEVIHKVRFGHPGAIMPAYGDPASTVQLNLLNIADVVAYTQTLSTPPPGGGTNPPQVSDLQIIARGGRLYDNWISETGVVPPTGDNPTWALQSDSGGTNTRTGTSTWRCKECHGWDYKGVNGVYGDTTNSHYTGFSGVFGTEKTEADIVTYLTNGFFYAPTQTTVHSFGDLIQPADIEALAKFIKQGTVDTSIYFGQDGIINGSQQDFLNGQDLYSFKGFGVMNGNCELCHGVNGDAEGTPPIFLGLVANENPWEFLHKVRFGQPNTAMPALIDPVDPLTGAAAFDIQDAVDVTHYSQSLPQQ